MHNPSWSDEEPAQDIGGSSIRAAKPTLGREWIVEPPHPQRERLAGEAGLSLLVAQVLLNRGVTQVHEIRPFLAPEFHLIGPPAELPGAIDAAAAICQATRNGERIVIYGDYDVDGVTGTAILYNTLRLAGANVDYYIPSRLDEGYGLNADAIEKLAADGARLVVSVDCGITAVDEARRARELGLRLIITDHHEPRPVLPDAEAIVHPTARGVACPNPHLSGSAVALKVAWAVAQIVSGADRVAPVFRECLLDATALASLGLIADVVPLTGENRVIASFGLKHLRHAGNPGLRRLIESAGLAEKSRAIDDYDVGFVLAPRLNAIGRMGHAAEAVELFTRADDAAARRIAAQLDDHNRRRQSVEREVLSSAEAMVRERGFDRAGCHGIVLAAEGWHPGVIGIVAARLVDRFHRPTVLISLAGHEGQGSGRSIRHFPLHEALGCCAEHLLSFGGHAMAAGVRIRADRVEPFTRAFLDEAGRRLTPHDLTPRLRLDDEVRLEELRTDVVEHLERMAPFGAGNARPRFATTPVQLAERPRVVGQTGAHLQFTVRQGTVHRKAIGFGMASQFEAIADARTIRLAFEPLINEWAGRRSVEMKVLDWKGA